MAKLIDDPKVAALVEKEVTKAIKEERKRVAVIIKGLAGAVKDSAEEVKNPSEGESGDLFG